MIVKLNSIHTSGHPEDFNSERQETGTPCSDLNGIRRIGPVTLQRKKRIISQDDDSLSLFAPSNVEDELQQE